MLIRFAFLIPIVLATTESFFEGGSSSMAIPDPMTTLAMESELRCALTCSRDAMCDMFTYNKSVQTVLNFMSNGQLVL